MTGTTGFLDLTRKKPLTIINRPLEYLRAGENSTAFTLPFPVAIFKAPGRSPLNPISRLDPNKDINSQRVPPVVKRKLSL